MERNELQQLALRVIEGLTFPDVVSPDSKKLNDIYRFAHIALGKCQNKHSEWLRQLQDAEKALIEMGIIQPTSKQEAATPKLKP